MVDFESAFKALVSVQELEELASRDYSDVRDAHGNQYVDLVMEGGGMLGLALLGYTYTLERCGIRFWSIAGTSAGGISAMLLAGLGAKEQAKSLRVLEHLNEVETSSFLDGAPEIRGIFERWLAGTLDKFKLATAIFASDSLEDLMRMGTFDPCWLEAYQANGLFPGEEFRRWVSGVLASAQVGSLADLQALLDTIPPGLEIIHDPRRGVEVEEMRSRLALIAADVTTESLVIFPEMAERYWPEPERVDPADFVRASMSIPFFFRPFEVAIAPEHRDRLKGWGKSGPPAKAVFVDGGILSNFPIAVFHDPGGIPTHPTFGVKLNPRRRPEQSTSTPGQLAGAIYNTARHSLDNDFLKKNREYKRLVAYIDTLDVNWLDFAMSNENKLLLFSQGVRAAVQFLNEFAWGAYKNLRHDMLQVPAINQLRREAHQVEHHLHSRDEFELTMDGHRQTVRILHQQRHPGGFEATVVHIQPGGDQAYSRYRVEHRLIAKASCLKTTEGRILDFLRVTLDETNHYSANDEPLGDDEAWLEGIRAIL